MKSMVLKKYQIFVNKNRVRERHEIKLSAFVSSAITDQVFDSKKLDVASYVTDGSWSGIFLVGPEKIRSQGLFSGRGV